MTYNIDFDERALKEWKKLDSVIRDQFKKKLVKLQINPKVESARLHDMKDCYKIKLRSSGYRMIYQVIDEEIVILVLAIGKREKLTAYKKAEKRI